MEIEYRDGHNQSPVAMSSAVQPVNAERVRKFLRVLQTYKEGKTSLEQRIQTSEQWWKLRNTEEGRQLHQPERLAPQRHREQACRCHGKLPRSQYAAQRAHGQGGGPDAVLHHSLHPGAEPV